MAEPKRPERKGTSSPYVTGPTKILDVTQPTGVARGAGPEAARPAARGELVTEGMKAHRREIEKHKRQAAIEKLHAEEQAADDRRTILKWTFWVVLVLVLAFAYRRMQDSYGNQWPIWQVWIVLAVALFAGIGWMIWYLNKTEL